MATLARSQGNFARPGGKLHPRACMTALAYRRFEEFAEEFRKVVGVDGDTSKCFVADVSQHLSQRRRVGSIFPAVCTSSPFSFSKHRFLTPADILFAHGWPLEESKFHSALRFSRSTLSLPEERQLMGNNKHLAHIGSVFLYMMSFSLRRETILSMWPLPRSLNLPPQRKLKPHGDGDEDFDNMRARSVSR